MELILEYLKKHGEQLDTAIAENTGIPLATVHLHLAELAAKNEVVVCQTIRFVDGEEFKGIICRIAGFTPKSKPGAKSGSKSKVQITLS